MILKGQKLKKLTALCLAAAMVFGACGNNGGNGDTTPAAEDVAQSTPAAGAEDPAGGLSNVQTENDIVVTLSTDKAEYEAGEEVNYTLTIENNRKRYMVTQVFVNYVSTAWLQPTADTDQPEKLKAIVQGGTQEITGKYIGVNPSDDTTAASAGNTNVTTGNDSITLRPYVQIKYAGYDATIRMIMTINMVQEKVDIPSESLVKISTAACHDPSIFKAEDGTYYVFGTHMGLASSTDLTNWKESNLKSKFDNETVAKMRAWSKDGFSEGDPVDSAKSGDWFSYIWAPDIIYNPVLEKYCIYYSCDGDDWVSNIVMLTADDPLGPYTYVDTVVYGGFTDETYDRTDVAKVTGEDSIPERYVTNGVVNRKWGDEYPNCIDPCVFYDDDGNLWMSYGSWSGGIFMLALDENTGLRDYSISYETNAHSDAYFGKKIAGGRYVSGEASYIQKIEDYYYLFISYGALEAKGGYNVRVYRSENPDGDYVDELGNSALYDKYVQNFNHANGIRLFGGYQWGCMSLGDVAQGHNSAFVDDDGRAYIVYHTRTTSGNEGHHVKVLQLFVNEDGWLVAAPYITTGEKLDESISSSDIIGDYDALLHTLGVDYENLGVNTPGAIALNADGTVDGDRTGTWEVKGSDITLVLDDITYHGKVLKQNIEGTSVETVVFTVLGVENQLALWGSRVLD